MLISLIISIQLIQGFRVERRFLSLGKPGDQLCLVTHHA